jgi:ATP-dependent RNA helicase DDX5/DBP2
MTSPKTARITFIVLAEQGYVTPVNIGLQTVTYLSLFLLLQRAGAKRTSYTYFTDDDSKFARELVSILRDAKANIPQQLEEMAMYRGSGGSRSESITFII